MSARLFALCNSRFSGLRANVPAMRSFHTSSVQEKYFDKILIANRGEIACRVMRTAQALGIKTVAIYSEADSNAVHTLMADEAVCVGPAASSKSYLNIPNVLDAIKKTGAQAVHPGYGFLSENADFVKTLEENGIKFIGPNASAMHAMGDKIESKKLAKAAGVNIIPGFLGEVHDPAEVLRIANEITYPVMIKASAGGGGKGMRIAWNDQEALDGFRLSKQEAASSFGDDRMLIEKFIDNPRHIEIQVLGDSFGNTVYLNERECSIQRRNQKVFEEAPSPFIDPVTRKAMGEQAVALAKAVKYQSAGTVEMLVDSKKNFYFLEMNTRLQVEHPITEYITGLDLVEQMIRVAAGEPLTFAQQDVKLAGWAMEARVYAEDPVRNFLPSIGRLDQYEEPIPADEEEAKFYRVDGGVRHGSLITPTYDPLISKLVTYGKNREAALGRMAKALDSYVIRGVEHNIPFLRDLLEKPTFKKGQLSTGFIPHEYPNGFKAHELTEKERTNLTIIAGLADYVTTLRDITTTGRLESAPTEIEFEKFITIGDRENELVITDRNPEEEEAEPVDGVFYAILNETVYHTRIEWLPGTSLLTAHIGDETIVAQVHEKTYKGYKIQYVGTKYDVQVATPLEKELLEFMPVKKKQDFSNSLISPMPGKIISLACKVGDKVAVNQEVAIVEAMKMQNMLRAPRDGVVKAIHVIAGSDVSVDQVLVEFEPLPTQ